jgi:hypothetical protein
MPHLVEDEVPWEAISANAERYLADEIAPIATASGTSCERTQEGANDNGRI